jgi:hypothetical protein
MLLLNNTCQQQIERHQLCGNHLAIYMSKWSTVSHTQVPPNHLINMLQAEAANQETSQ